MHPNRLLVLMISSFMYIFMTVSLLFIEIPKLLREDHTPTNLLGILLAFIWFAFTIWATYLWWFNKKHKSVKGTKNENP